MKRRWDSLPIAVYAVLFLVLLAVPSVVLIILNGIDSRNDAVDEARHQCLDYVNRIGDHNEKSVTAAKQLLIALSELPDVWALNAAGVTPILVNLLRSDPTFANIALVDPSGLVRASAVPMPGKVSVTDRRYFQEAVRTGELSSGEYQVGRIINKPNLNFGYPVKNGAHDLIGVLFVALNLEHAQQTFDVQKLPAGSAFRLLDHRGVVLTANVPDRPSATLIGRPDNQPELFLKMVTGADAGTYEAIGNDGLLRLYAYKKLQLPHEEKPYMYVRVSVPMAAVTAKANRAFFRELSLFSVLFFIILFTAWRIQKRAIVNPVLALKGAVVNLSVGVNKVRAADTVTGGELGQLAKAFDEMAETLLTRERQLKEREEQFRTLTESAPEAIFVQSRGRFVYLNPAMVSLVGASRPEELLGREFSDCIAPEYLDRIRERIQHQRETGKAAEPMEQAYLRLDGSRVPVETTAIAIRYRGEEAHLVFVRDITERLRAQEALRTYQEHLEEMVHLRTRELAEARDQAESASRAKSAFLSSMSHELRTPLNIIMGTTYLLGRNLTGGASRENLATIEQSSQRLLRMVNDIIAFTKAEADQIRISEIDFDLSRLLDQAAAEILDTVSEKGLELAREVDPELPARLRGDFIHLGQVLRILLSNAVKFSSRGRIALRACLEGRGGPVPWVRFEVEDQGIGIAPELRNRLFQLFEQGDSALSRKYEGIGLGLALGKRLVSLMAGEIGFRSGETQGSLFWFSVPLQCGAVSPAGETGKATAGYGDRMGKIVASLEKLLADDDLDARSLWEESAAVLKPLLKEKTAEFDQAIKSFDFEAAQRLLQEAVAASGRAAIPVKEGGG